MKAKLIVGFLAFILLMLPAVSGIEHNQVKETHRQRFIERLENSNFISKLFKLIGSVLISLSIIIFLLTLLIPDVSSASLGDGRELSIDGGCPSCIALPILFLTYLIIMVETAVLSSTPLIMILAYLITLLGASAVLVVLLSPYFAT